MASNTIQLLEISDDQALTAIEQVLGSHSDSHVLVDCRVFDSGTGTSLPLSGVRADSSVESILREKGDFFKHINAHGTYTNNRGSVSVTFNRTAEGRCQASLNLDGQVDGDAQIRTKLAIDFHRAFHRYHLQRVQGPFPPEMEQFYARRESTLIRLEEVATEVTINTKAHRAELDRLFDERQRRLEDSLSERAKDLHVQFEAKVKALDTREAALAKREEELDKADNTNARRKLRKDLKEALLKGDLGFSLSDVTVR